METYIYGDVILLENFIMNFLILWSTAKLTRYGSSKFNLAAASLIGALYAVFSYIPRYGNFYTLLMKVIMSLLIIVIAYVPSSLNQLLKLTGVFYIISFIFGGAAFGLFYFVNGLKLTKSGVSFISEFPFKLLLASVVIAYIAVRYSWDYVQNRIKRERILTNIDICFEGKTIKINALVDTGNSLKDPITGSPVVIAEYDVIRELLPPEVQRIFTSYIENDLKVIAEIMSDSQWLTRFRVIPFRSLGRENGMMIGFRPDAAYITEDGKSTRLDNLIIGIYRKKLSKDGEYSALIHPDMFKAG